MTDVLGSKIDFIKDIRKEDRFRVIYESHTSQGQTIAAGRILAIEYENDGETHQALWFDEGDGGGSYYDFEGNSIQGAFLRNAIKFTRISSTFGKRRHPIHGSWRNHNGVDYAAPKAPPSKQPQMAWSISLAPNGAMAMSSSSNTIVATARSMPTRAALSRA